MSNLLFVTSNQVMCSSLVKDFILKKNKDLYKGDIDLLSVENNKIDSTLHLTRVLSTNKGYTKVIVVNPIQCPDSSIPYGQIIMAEDIIEWDKPILTTKRIQILVKDIPNVIIGKGMSGDRECQGRTTPISQSKLVDTITYPLAKVSEYFNLPILSIGIVADHCTPNYSRLLQTSIQDLSSKMVSFIKEILPLLSD